MGLKDKVAVVTGAGEGIGRAIALGLARDGAKLVLTGRRENMIKKVEAEIEAIGREALAIRMDVTKWEDAEAMVKRTIERFGKIDILVNNVGRSEFRFFHEAKVEDIDSIIDVNLKGVLYCCRAVINHMMQRRSGKIINIGTGVADIGCTKTVDYVAAKAGVIAFTKSLAKEAGPYGINVNCVSPGPIVTSKYPKTGETWEKRVQMMALRRLGRPEDIANMVLFLAQDEASFITGQNYSVCGGRSLGLEVE